MSPTVAVSRDIAASPAAVFAAISDVTRMGEWSPECHRCEWHAGATAAAVGVGFDGHNRSGDVEWTTQGRIVACEPGRRFVFDVAYRGVVFATWGYEIEETPGGCRVTETWEDKRPQKVIDGEPTIAGVDDRAAHNAAGMEATLAALATVVERDAPPSPTGADRR